MPVKVFVLDLDSSGDTRRHWNEILDSHRECTWYAPLDADRSGRVDPRPTEGAVLVCHQWDEAVLNAVKDLAKQGVVVVLVSLASDKGQQLAPGIYRRGRSVGRPTDPHFKVCFQWFIGNLEANNTPDWKLLEGPPPPDAMFAYHLLDLFLKDDPEAEDARRALRATAIAEAQAIAGATPIPPLEKIDHAAQRRVFLRAC
jgi:hypothetical protein